MPYQMPYPYFGGPDQMQMPPMEMYPGQMMDPYMMGAMPYGQMPMGGDPYTQQMGMPPMAGGMPMMGGSPPIQVTYQTTVTDP